MRAVSLMIPILLTMALPAPSGSEPPNINPSAAAEANEASWAHLDAQARMADGDYEGAVQAEQTADAARKHADELAAHTPANPPQNDARRNAETAR